MCLHKCNGAWHMTLTPTLYRNIYTAGHLTQLRCFPVLGILLSLVYATSTRYSRLIRLITEWSKQQEFIFTFSPGAAWCIRAYIVSVEIVYFCKYLDRKILPSSLIFVLYFWIALQWYDYTPCVLKLFNTNLFFLSHYSNMSWWLWWEVKLTVWTIIRAHTSHIAC